MPPKTRASDPCGPSRSISVTWPDDPDDEHGDEATFRRFALDRMAEDPQRWPCAYLVARELLWIAMGKGWWSPPQGANRSRFTSGVSGRFRICYRLDPYSEEATFRRFALERIAGDPVGYPDLSAVARALLGEGIRRWGDREALRSLVRRRQVERATARLHAQWKRAQHELVAAAEAVAAAQAVAPPVPASARALAELEDSVRATLSPEYSRRVAELNGFGEMMSGSEQGRLMDRAREVAAGLGGEWDGDRRDD